MTLLSAEEWNELKKGVNCSYCKDIFLPENAYSFKVADLRQSIVRLPRNQYMRGWTIVALKRHASELFELAPQELYEFWLDVSQVAHAMYDIYQPAKIYYVIMGNKCPHIHVNLLLHHFGEELDKPISMEDGDLELDLATYATMVKTLQQKLVSPAASQ